MPLLHAALRRPKGISLADLKLLRSFFRIESGDSSGSGLLKAVAARCGDDQFVDSILQKDERTTESCARTLMADPFVEAAFDEMPADDQGEFPELVKEKHSRKHRRHEAGRTWMAPLHPQRMRHPQTKHCPDRETNPKFGQPALSTTIHFQLEPTRRQTSPRLKG